MKLSAVPGQPGAAILAVILTVLTGCETGPATEARATISPAGRPQLTNAEYEMQQLRALGAIGDGRPADLPPPSVRPAPDLARGETTRLILPQVQLVPRSTAAAGVSPPPVAGRPAPVRTGPVQKVGSTYLGPGGVTSRRVGSIMLNSDGTTGQLIGNTIINH